MAQMFTIRLRNEPGALAALTRHLAEEGINIRAAGAAVAGPDGHATLITTDEEHTREVLRAAQYEFSQCSIVTAYVEDRPGAIARATGCLADAGVNIEGMLILRWYQGKAEVGFAVSDVRRAQRALGGLPLG